MSRHSVAFDLLHPGLQRWIHREGWRTLRPIQEAATEPILAAKQDVVLAAATAGGKTEAAFFPILTALANHPASHSVAALCVSPLKALINDQFDRLADLGGCLDLAVHRWHGDVPASHKKRLLQEPSGLLLITPESLEALLVRRGHQVRSLLGALRYVVVDELHAFIGSERGRQLQSLLHRVELAVRRQLPRIALSATLGDLALAAEFLRPRQGDRVLLIEDQETGQEVKLQVRGYLHRAVTSNPSQEEASDDGSRSTGGAPDIAGDLFDRLRGGHHLIFANRRAEVEQYADLLRRLCTSLGVPTEFHPHHGSLSREMRAEAERAINDRRRPATLIATTTLELGIDIGSIESVVQIGTPPSVAALRQRLGRSGRQGDPAILRVVVQEPEVTSTSQPANSLRPELLQSVAMVELLIEGWVEPPTPSSLHLSTLVQQTLSLLAQTGGADARSVWRALCASGPFSEVDSGLFEGFLRSLGAADLITQDHTGELVLGLEGERLVDHYSFYAAFSSPEEYRLMVGDKTLGKLPIGHPLFPGLLLIFAGRRWKVLAVDEERKLVDLTPARGGRTPNFIGSGGPAIHDRVRRKMLALYQTDRMPHYLDSTARDLLDEAREWFRRLELGQRSLLGSPDSTLFFPWSGDRIMGTLALMLASEGVEVSLGSVHLEAENIKPEGLTEILDRLEINPPPEPLDLAQQGGAKQTEKFHPYLEDRLLLIDYASSSLDVPGAVAALGRISPQRNSRSHRNRGEVQERPLPPTEPA